MSFIYLNGRIVPTGEARISVNDRAVVFGDAAYETMRSYSGRFFRFSEHLTRLREALRGMSLTLPTPDEAITGGAVDLIRANGLEDARLRLTVTGGLHDGAIRLRRSHPPNLILTATPLEPPGGEHYRGGVEAILARWRVHRDSPLARMKTTNRLVHLMAKEEALERGAWDALFLDDSGNILEGTATNVFFVVDGRLRTPSLSSPLLAGVTRDAVLEIAKEAKVPVQEEAVSLDEASGASEAFLTSTTIEVLPIRSLEGRPVGSGVPGPVASKLHRRYREMVARETGVDLGPVF